MESSQRGNKNMPKMQITLLGQEAEMNYFRKVSLVCNVCKKEFKVKPSREHKRKNCSRKCMSESYKIKLRGNSNPNFKNAGRKICLYCKKEYHAYNKNRKFCGVLCAESAAHPVRTIKVKHNPKKKRCISKCFCLTCGKHIRKINKHKLCAKCYYEKRKVPRLIIICSTCGVKYEQYKSSKTGFKYCSWKCVQKKGNNNPNWKGGKKTFKAILRSCEHYKTWRKEVFFRDNYTCQVCNIVGYELQADHIIPFSYIIKKYNIQNMEEAILCNLLWDISNGRTLCVNCHKKTYSYLNNKIRMVA